MIGVVEEYIEAFEVMRKYPKELYFKGNLAQLQRAKIAIVGSRKPNQYAREMTHQLVKKLTKVGVCIVSGGAIGVDAIAHKAAGAENSVMVSATGLDKRYPAINAKLIESIENRGLVLSQFCVGTPSQKYNFVLRNELIVALGDALIVTYADLNSGTMRSVEYALKMGKKIYVLSHRIGESQATNRLLQEGKAEAIYDLDKFVEKFGSITKKRGDDFLDYCTINPTYEETLKKFPNRLFEAELSGEIVVKNGRVFLD